MDAESVAATDDGPGAVDGRGVIIGPFHRDMTGGLGGLGGKNVEVGRCFGANVECVSCIVALRGDIAVVGCM